MNVKTYAQDNPVSVAGAVTGLLVALVTLGLDAVELGDSVEAQLVVLGSILAAIVGGLIGRYAQRWTISLAVPVAEGDDIDHGDDVVVEVLEDDDADIDISDL